tara:strand:+ start:157 stop:495 length:339 start_codon:yes stop_codon:yes gene_type:complete
MINKDILLEGLDNLGSRDYQERFWLKKEPTGIYTFDEGVCYVFDDSNLERARDNGYLGDNFSKLLCRKVCELRALVKKIPLEASEPEIFHHPAMEKIRKLSNELKVLFSEEL